MLTSRFRILQNNDACARRRRCSRETEPSEDTNKVMYGRTVTMPVSQICDKRSRKRAPC